MVTSVNFNEQLNGEFYDLFKSTGPPASESPLNEWISFHHRSY